MPRSQTIDVLNDADEMQRRLDWVLFANENEHIGTESDWTPGDPLFDRPCSCWDCGEQHIRPMFEMVELNYFHSTFAARNVDPYMFGITTSPTWVLPNSHCTSCDVRWTGDDPCWICGEEQPKAKRSNRYAELLVALESDIRIGYEMSFQEALDGLLGVGDEAFDRRLVATLAAQRLAGWSVQVSIYDELTEEFVVRYQSPELRPELPVDDNCPTDSWDPRDGISTRWFSREPARYDYRYDVEIELPWNYARYFEAELSPPEFHFDTSWFLPRRKAPATYPGSNNPTRERRPRRV